MKQLFVAFGALFLAACGGGDGEATTEGATGAETSAAQPPSVTGAFRMTVQDSFIITQRGLVATGAVAYGTVHVGDTVCLSGPDTPSRELKVEGIEMFRKEMQSASIGDIVGLLLGDLEKDTVKRGDMLKAC